MLAATSSSDAFFPELEDSLTTLRMLLSTYSNQGNGLAATETLVSVYRRPDGATPALGGALREYARVRAARGVEVQEALTAAMTAASIFGQLAQRLPGAFAVDLKAAQDTVAEVITRATADLADKTEQ
jgi:hypothetical protein